MSHLIKLLTGAVVFAAVLLAPLNLSYQGHVVLATFACAIVWWITQPMPWAATALLPVVVFPAAGVMDVTATIGLYGQTVIFWVMGTVLIGFAIEKHGVARRMALALLSLPGIAARTHRLLFVYMLAVAIISAFVSDVATIAMMIPIGMLVVRHVRHMDSASPGNHANLAAFVSLGTLYAAIAGGTLTLMGIPHNAVAISALEKLTGRQLGLFEWMLVGGPVCLGMFATSYLTLRLLVRPEMDEIPGGEAFVRAERAKLGPIGADERRVLGVFVATALLFLLPSVLRMVVGTGHPMSVWADRALAIWVVPPIAMLLLFTIRSAEHPGSALLTWKDAERRTPWGAILLVTGAVAMTDAMGQFGLVDFVGSAARHLSTASFAMPYVIGGIVTLSTNLISGVAATAMYCSIFVPAASELAFSPAAMAMLIANLAVGLMFPWAGSAAATAFATGEVTVERMMKVGLVASVANVIVVATIHTLMGWLL